MVLLTLLELTPEIMLKAGIHLLLVAKVVHALPRLVLHILIKVGIMFTQLVVFMEGVVDHQEDNNNNIITVEVLVVLQALGML